MGTVQDLVTDRMDVWATAIRRRSTAGRGMSKKLELYGIQKLRELILELAVRGLLVPQDPAHEPVSELLKAITAERGKLLAEGKINKEKPLPPIDAAEMPFELPKGWKWVRVADIGYDFGQKIPSQNFTYIDVGAINNRFGFIDSPTILSANEAPSRARKIVKNGTVIYSTVRPYLLNIAIVQKDFDPEPIASTAFAVIHPFANVSSGFIYRYLRSPSFVSYVESVQTGIAYPAINDKQFFSGLLPLPPTTEQHQIVAKVDELMKLCDRLEQQTEASLEAHQTLVETLLNALASAANHSQFASAWQRIAEHFDTLFTTEESIDQLTQTILQLAVLGKLVPQATGDEPASELLKRIAAEKVTLVREGKLKKGKQRPPIAEKEMPFALPQGWEWTDFDRIAKNENNALKAGPFGSALKKSMYVPSGYKIYGQEQVISGDEKIGDYFIDATKYSSLESCSVQPGDILISLVGTIGKVLVLSKNAQRGIINPRLVKLSLFNLICREYIKIVLGSKLIQEELYSQSHGSTMDVLNLGLLKALIFPLPPPEEQHRIVAKVDELMAISEQLKVRLKEAQATQLYLADVLTEKALTRHDEHSD